MLGKALRRRTAKEARIERPAADEHLVRAEDDELTDRLADHGARRYGASLA